MSMLTSAEKTILLLGVVFVVGFTMCVSALDTAKRYRLPSGDVVTCRSMKETSKGSFRLWNCDDGVEYYVQGTIEVLK
jgi:hypothetical protein